MNELLEIAINAYRNGRYAQAIELLLQIVDADGSLWMARLYLSMSYQKTGRVADAHRSFKRLAEQCTDAVIRIKAENALPLVEAEMRRRFAKEALVSQGDESDDLVWVA
jgi:hypothetical protein